jgi:ADP-ribose pyrophosphatase
MNNINKIPSSAKQVFKGKIFDVWQWEQKMFDGSTETFECLKRPHTAQVIAVVGDRILVQTERQPNNPQASTTLPGGRFNEGETPLQAAQRELREETGYTSNDWKLWKEVSPVSKIEWSVFTFIARNCIIENNQQLDSGEEIQTRLVSFDEFITIVTEDPSFYSLEIVSDLLRLQLNPDKKEKFRKMLFENK